MMKRFLILIFAVAAMASAQGTLTIGSGGGLTLGSAGASAGVSSINGTGGAFTFTGGVTCTTTTCNFTGASMVYPSGTGVPEVTSGTSWGSTYNAANQIPANFVNLSTYLLTATAASTYAPIFTLTVTGSSGAATYSGNVLNIPTYSFTQVYPSAGVAASTGSAWRTPLYTDITALWAGGSCSGGLKSDGTCFTPNTGTVTSFAAPSGSWPTWLVPTVTNSTTTPSLAVAASSIPYSALTAISANTLLGALTGTTPSGQAVPSCSTSTSALTWTSGTGFGCNTITPGTGTVTHTVGPLTVNAVMVGNGLADSQVGDFANTPGTNLLNSSVSATTNTTYSAGQDAANTGTMGKAIIRGANQTASTTTGYSSAVAGGVLISAGSNASGATGSQAGSVEINPGMSTNGGEQGVAIYAQMYNEGTGSHTQWTLQCIDSSASQTADDCGAMPTTILGVTDFHTGTVEQIHGPGSITPVIASAAVTLGHTVCADGVAGEVTDSGGTAACTVGITVGQVVAVSGAWTFADGSSSTITTTLPLVYMWKLSSVGGGDIVGAITNNTSGNAATTSAISGMTSAQVAIAGSANTITGSKVLAGSGAGITTGPTTAVTGDVMTSTGTGGQIADSGTTLASLALLVSPSFTTPTLGVATATSVNKVAITAPATSATLTLAQGSTLQTTGANTLNLTTTGAATPSFPAATDTVVELTQTQTLTNKSIAGSEINSGTVPIAQIPTGTTSSTVPLGGVITAGGPTGNATSIPVITYNAAGQLTAVTTATPSVTVVNGLSPTGAGAAIPTGPATSTNLDCVQFTGTSGQIADSGGPCGGGSSSFPLTVSGTVNSGGIPYFNSTTQESSSAAGTVNTLMKWGGAGTAPTSSAVTESSSTLAVAEQETVTSTAIGNVPLTVNGFSSGQTANLQNWYNYSGGTLEADISNTGNLYAQTVNTNTISSGTLTGNLVISFNHNIATSPMVDINHSQVNGFPSSSTQIGVAFSTGQTGYWNASSSAGQLISVSNQPLMGASGGQAYNGTNPAIIYYSNPTFDFLTTSTGYYCEICSLPIETIALTNTGTVNYFIRHAQAGGSLAAPNFAVNEAGEESATDWNPTTIYSAAGTALPTCASGIKGRQAVVSDATTPLYMTAYTSGGGITAAVICSYNGTTYSWLTH